MIFGIGNPIINGSDINSGNDFEIKFCNIYPNFEIKEEDEEISLDGSKDYNYHYTHYRFKLLIYLYETNSDESAPYDTIINYAEELYNMLKCDFRMKAHKYTGKLGLISGTADSNVLNKLHDTEAFTKDESFYKNYYAHNTDADTYAKITGKDSDDQLALESDIFPNGNENYEFGLILQFLQTKEFTFNSGSSGTTIKLNDNMSAVDDFYNNFYIYYDDERRKITDYTGSTKTAIIDSAFTSDPTDTDVYTIDCLFHCEKCIDHYLKDITQADVMEIIIESMTPILVGQIPT